jgi:hypothetical protein
VGKEPPTPKPWRLTLFDKRKRYSVIASTGYTGFIGRCTAVAEEGSARRRRFTVDLGNIYARPRTEEEVQDAIKNGERADHARRNKYFPLREMLGKDTPMAVEWLTESMGQNKGGDLAAGYRTRACILRYDTRTGRLRLIYPHEQMLAQPIVRSELPELVVAGTDSGVATCALRRRGLLTA